MLRYSSTIFLSAFLLFAVQPLIGKYILPWFGGTPGVWTTCMLMFQSLLLCGYAYAHGVASAFSTRKQALLHLALLAASLALLPITPSEHWKPVDGTHPEIRILALIAATVGLPYLVLSSTGPLMQSWFGRSFPGRSPYRLYSLSNVGSLLALVGYPILIEPQMTLGMQTITWSASYVVFIASCAWCAIALWRMPAESSVSLPQPNKSTKPNKEVKSEPPSAPPTLGDKFFWIALSACGSMLLLAVTNHVSQEVAVVPFLWVLPLALYLLTFILCFDHPRWYHRGVWATLWWGSLIVVVYSIVGFDLTVSKTFDIGLIDDLIVGYNELIVREYVEPLKNHDRIGLQLTEYMTLLFSGCMLCHGELTRSKPHPRHLTGYFLTIAAGGALGGLFVALAAPQIFVGYWELHFALSLTLLFFYWALFRDPASPMYHGKFWEAWAPLLSGYIVVLVFLNQNIRLSGEGILERTRNFYGTMRVMDVDTGDGVVRQLVHGTINHGIQFVDDPRSQQPTSYYGPKSGIGLALLNHPKRFDASSPGLKIGVVGLGTGSVAVYGMQNDNVRFYEINPEVIRISDKWFTYRQDAEQRGATTNVVLGDARLQMEFELRRNEPQLFDVLTIDAFSSDAIPIHLLTKECFEIYWKHLRPDGLLVVHVSNRHLDLKPVVRGLAAEFDKDVKWFSSAQDASFQIETANWLVVTSNERYLNNPVVQAGVKGWQEKSPEPFIWTDSHSSLLRVLDKRNEDREEE